MKNNWPFSDPRSTVVFTTLDFVEKRKPILRVTHNETNGAWQFDTEETAAAVDARITALGEILFLDPSLVALADLPRGWIAVRASFTAQWKRHSMKKSDGDIAA